MATSQVNGKNFSLEGERVEFYGCIGTVLSSGNWAINGFGGGLLVEVDPDSMLDSIQACIDDDVASGNEGKIARLLLAPRSAVVFFLEGQITRNHLRNAVEGDGYIDIPEVPVLDRVLTVRVIENPVYTVATADAVGNVL